MKKKIILLIILVAVVHLVFRIYGYMGEYTKPFDAKYWENKYLNSQWVKPKGCIVYDPHINPETCTWDDHWYEKHKNDPKVDESLGDDGLYTYAGWKYINGQDPTLLNAEVPPLGKYLIGLSELIFKNQNIFGLLSGVFVLLGLYLLNTLLFRDKLLALLPVALLSFEPLFYTQLRAPFLDLLYLGLLLMTFYFFLRQKYVVSSGFLGLMAATKASALTFPLVIIVLLGFLLLTRKYSLIKKYVISLPVTAIVFLATYFQFFLQGNSLIEFLGVQKWVINFYNSGASGSSATVWEVLFTGSWHAWWGELTHVVEWHIGWPLLFVISLCSTVLILQHNANLLHARSKRKPEIDEDFLLLILWLIAYFIFLMMAPFWPRYLLLALPFMYNLATWLIGTKVMKTTNV